MGKATEENDDYMDNDEEDQKKGTYQGEGFPRLVVVNNALGFFKNGKLVLVPVHDIYDMQPHFIEEKASSSKIDEGKLAEMEKGPTKEVTGPVRVKFGRTENDFKKKRRENSSLHKQKLIDEDPWIPLVVEKKQPTELYKSYYDTEDSRPSIKTEVADTSM